MGKKDCYGLAAQEIAAFIAESIGVRSVLNPCSNDVPNSNNYGVSDALSS